LICGKRKILNQIFISLLSSSPRLSLIKNYKQRPKYVELMLQPFFIESREQPVDMAGWYREVTNAAMEKQRR
jgi:hypothetical protein